MINICYNELVSLDLTINVNKSKCIRVGEQYKTKCHNLSINGLPIAWTNNFSYLGVTIKSSVKFAIDIKSSRANFYRAFNSLYSKIYKANEFLIVSLVKTFCVPLFMFSLSAVILNASSLKSIDSLLYSAFGKIFKSFDHKILDYCMFYSNCLPSRFEYFNRRMNLLSKLEKIENSVLITWGVISGHKEMTYLCRYLNIDLQRPFSIRKCIWRYFT